MQWNGDSCGMRQASDVFALQPLSVLGTTSVVESKSRINDYDSTAGETGKSAKEYYHRQAGDPAKLAQAMLKLVAAEKPPIRLQMGADAVGIVENKNAFVSKELASWRGLSTATDL